MLCNPLRQEVLKTFKNLHRTSLRVFKNNDYVLKAAKKEINEGFKKNKNISELSSIKELIKFANDVAHELRTGIAELEETSKPGVYELKLRPEMFEESNNDFKKTKTHS